MKFLVYIGLIVSTISYAQKNLVLDLATVDSKFDVSKYYYTALESIHGNLPKEHKNLSRRTGASKFETMRPIFVKDTLYSVSKDNTPFSLVESYVLSDVKSYNIYGYVYSIGFKPKNDTVAKINDLYLNELVMIEKPEKNKMVFLVGSTTVPNEESNQIKNKDLIDQLILNLSSKYGKVKSYKSTITEYMLYDWEFKNHVLRIIPSGYNVGRINQPTKKYLELQIMVVNKKYIPELKSLKHPYVTGFAIDFSMY
ncbi:hypothetical protein [Moheibacter sediminis]|uniref:Uncharacterized protein n=1 Tax=Moheibacter sediminis TaxID=1434700 RepID=A0A1W1ZVC9_9FLAO|nr:hypothetical protein [Moheibacter sediminis]SMC52061.1 hypothetical protein SAMN06296427_103252 [Moheibacter sediminis]